MDGTLTLTVERKRILSEGVVELLLRDPEGRPLPAWEPGAHIDLILAPDLVRQYSLTGSPESEQWRIAVLREPRSRGGSAHIHEQLAEGAPIQVSAPRNAFAFHAEPQVLFVAGGIGITPILAMIDAAERAGVRWRLLYGGRAAGSMAYTEELSRYGDRVVFWPQDERGFLPLADEFAALPPGCAVYACGPEPLLAALETLAEQHPANPLHLERFRAKEQPVTAELPFEVELAASGQRLTVTVGQSLLDRVRAAGVFAPSSCREGTCGACETTVLEGTPDHRDSVLSPAERAQNDCMMICVSRSLGPRLVLDL